MYKEIKGDLIKLALEGEFDVIAHGCNCFCTMKSGIAPQMATAFGCDKYPREVDFLKGDINKLGSIDVQKRSIQLCYQEKLTTVPISGVLIVINAYTQYYYGRNSPGCNQPLDYSALTLCLRKINHIFKGKHIGLPQIGCGLAGGDWNKVKEIIQKELCDMNITIVILP